MNDKVFRIKKNKNWGKSVIYGIAVALIWLFIVPFFIIIAVCTVPAFILAGLFGHVSYEKEYTN